MKRTLIVTLCLVFLLVTVAPSVRAAPVLGSGSTSGLTTTESTVLKGLDYGNAWTQLNTITAFGERVAGTDQERLAQQYVYDELSAMPMDKVVMETFPVQSWVHYGTSIQVVSPTLETIPGTTYGDCYSVWGRDAGQPYSFGNTNDGKTLVAPLRDLGYGTAADFDAAGNLAGVIALVHRDDDIQGWPNVPTIEASAHNAAAVVFYGYYGTYPLPDGIKQDSVKGPIPAFSISPRSAWHLQDLLEAGPVTLQINGRADIISDHVARSVNVAAYLYGTTHPDQYVVISGHIDTWWSGADDDTSSIAAMLELARLFSNARVAGTLTNERTLVFASVGAEETGGPDNTWYNWLVGSYEFVKAHPEILAGLAVELNMDGVSLVKPSGKYWVENTWEVNGFVAKGISDLGLGGIVGFYNPVWSWTDAWSYAAKGGGSTIQLLWVAGYDATYHTQLDDMAEQSPATMAVTLKMHGLWALRAASALIVPVELQYTADYAIANLKSEKATIPAQAAQFDAAIAAAGIFRERAVAMNARADQIRAAYAAAVTDEERAAAQAQADALNRQLIDARRVATVWTFGEGGLMGSWDVFLRPAQYVHDLAAVNKAIGALSKGQIGNAIVALEGVYTMEWGKYYSRATFLELLREMMDVSMYWGADFQQQQSYVDVQGIYLGLKDGTLSKGAALSQLRGIADSQLSPWLAGDLGALRSAYLESAGILT
jgi:Iap family predicted aminopeptidase